MKKLFSTILLLCLCFGVVSCTPDEPEISYESEIINQETGFKYLEIVERYGVIWGLETKERHIPNKTIEFMGKKYTGKYDYSYAPMNDLMPSYKSYYDSDNKVRFEIDDATGKVIGFSRNSMDVAAEEKTNNSTPDYQKFLIDTRKIAEEYIGDISECKIFFESLDLNRSDNSFGYGFKVNYIKKEQGYPTSEFVLISMSHSGIIEDFRVGHIGAFDDFTEEIDKVKVRESIDATLLNRYNETGATIKDIVVSEEYLFKTSDGKVCLLSDVTVYLTLSDGTETIEHPLMSTLIKN